MRPKGSSAASRPVLDPQHRRLVYLSSYAAELEAAFRRLERGAREAGAPDREMLIGYCQDALEVARNRAQAAAGEVAS